MYPLATSTYGRWEPATFEGREVSAAFDLSLPFLPDYGSCKEEVSRYKQANERAHEGAQLFADGETEAGMAKLTEAIEAFPNNAEFLLMRGQAYLDQQMYSEACTDLRTARAISLVTWYDAVLPTLRAAFLSLRFET